MTEVQKDDRQLCVESGPVPVEGSFYMVSEKRHPTGDPRSSAQRNLFSAREFKIRSQKKAWLLTPYVGS